MTVWMVWASLVTLLLAGAVVLTLPAVGAFLFAQRLFLDDPLARLRRRR